MKYLSRLSAPESAQRRPAAEPEPFQRHATASPYDDSPRITAQRQSLDRLRTPWSVQRIAAEATPPPAGGVVTQRVADGDEEEAAPALQARSDDASGGLPAQLRAGIEALSGLSMSGVRVHRNSSQPAQLNALAYAQGNEIHLAPGQEQHLPHEAWHVVQQAQGRVAPTRQMKGGAATNDDADLEHEADVMGARALQMQIPRGDVAARRHATPAALQTKAIRDPGKVYQLKPLNYYRTYRLPFKGNKFNGYKGERNPHAAQEINRLRSNGVISTGADLIGGHLLKAELGGEDVRDNVVPWSAGAESKFTSYEIGYQKRIDQSYQWRKQDAAPDWNHEWKWSFATSAQFSERKLEDFSLADDWNNPVAHGGWSATELDEILEILSCIPVETMVNPGNTIDFFTNSQSDISGTIKILKKPLVAASVVAPDAGRPSEEALNKKFKNRVEHNWKVLLSSAERMLENMKNEDWVEHLQTYWQDQKYQLVTAMHYVSKDGPYGDRTQIAPKKMYTLSDFDFFTSKGEMEGGWESMRRSAIDNPVVLPSRYLQTSIKKMDVLIQDGFNKTLNGFIDWSAEVPRARWLGIDL